MPVLASGFDFDDYVPDFSKGRGRGYNTAQKKEIRYSSKRYGGMGQDKESKD
jgi:hypothetical protein